MSVGVEGQTWVAAHTFSGNHVEQIGALNALSSGPEWLVSWTQNLVLVFFDVLVPVSAG